MQALTEKDAAIAYARVWNSLDCTDFIPLLAENACYASMYVLNELRSRAEIEEYLTGKLETVSNSGTQVRAELAGTTMPQQRACVLLYQDDGEHIATILFQIHDGKIQRYDLCAPELHPVRKTGIFPT